VAASLNPVIDFFNAGGDSGLPRPELRFTDDIRKTGPRIDYPVPPRRPAFLNVKFCAAMSQDCSSSFLSISDHSVGVPLPTTLPPFRFQRADKMRLYACFQRCLGGPCFAKAISESGIRYSRFGQQNLVVGQFDVARAIAKSW
jgi:hypothetical protein